MKFSPPSRQAILLAALLPTLAFAAPPTVDLSADASRPAPNDLARATVFAEATGTTPGDIARRVNGLVADGLATAKAYPTIRTQSGGTRTYPIYASKGGRIESWRMRSELTLESTDMAALSELLGKLQANLGVTDIALLPSPDTSKKAEDAAIGDALAAFRNRAQLVADILGKPYRITHLVINTSGRAPIMPMVRAYARVAEAAPMPVEAGESQVTVSVSGQIEIGD